MENKKPKAWDLRREGDKKKLLHFMLIIKEGLGLRTRQIQPDGMRKTRIQYMLTMLRKENLVVYGKPYWMVTPEKQRPLREAIEVTA